MAAGILYNFVINCKDEDLDFYRAVTDFSSHDMERTDLGWCLQTYAKLCKGHLSVRCSNKLVKDAINIVHSAQLLYLEKPSEHFIVCIRADFPRRRWAQFHIVQNATQLQRHTCLMPLWIQPGLIARNSNRKEVTTIAYTGVPYNGNLAEPAEGWNAFFEPHGFSFIRLGTGRWNDLSAVDILLGVRSFDKKRFHNKPPSKLLNAWHAGIPFIGGVDSAYEQVGEPGKDYLISRSAEEILETVLRLRDDELLYRMLVDNGRRKASRYTNEKIAGCWEEILTGPVLRRYAQWQKRKYFEKIRAGCLYGMAMLFEKIKGWLREKNLDPVRLNQLSANRKVV